MLLNDLSKVPYLANDEANELLKKHGRNVLKDSSYRSFFSVFIEQYKSPLVLVLITLSGVSFYLSEATDALVIMSVLTANALISSFQQRRAQQAVNSLKSMISSQSKAIRDGRMQLVNSDQIVPGDTVYIESGDRIPADGRALESYGLSVNESQLTGESNAVEKESSDTLWMGTYAMSGKAILQVEKTGMKTRIGKITESVSKKAFDSSPLEAQTTALTKKIMIYVGILIFILLTLRIAQGYALNDIFHSAVALAISAIPEGLPLLLAITLAIGAYNIGKKNAIMKNLASVVTMASVDVICTDKTGTLTEGILTLNNIYSLNFNSLLELDAGSEKTLFYGVLCNSALVEVDKQGDLLDLSILEYAHKKELDTERARRENPMIDEIPFSSETRYQATLHDQGGTAENLLLIKGAPDLILPFCTNFEERTGRDIEQVIELLASQGYRIVAMARKFTKSKKITTRNFNEMDFIGLLVFADNLREGVVESITEMRNAGIKTIILTGDHPITARAIGERIGNYDPELHTVITGSEISADYINEIGVDKLSIIARAKPENKVEILRLLRANGHIVGMTGDGLNDGPSLVESDIGIAMGFSGTDVAKESADMILTDDNYNTVVVAISEARAIVQNIRKVVGFIFTTSMSETFIFITAAIINLPSPLLASHVLFLNLFTDGILGISLANEKREKDLKENDRNLYRNILSSSEMWQKTIFVMLTSGIINLTLFAIFIQFYSMEVARTLLIINLTLSQSGIAFLHKSINRSSFWINPLKNPYLIYASIFSIAITAAFIYVAPLAEVLGFAPVSLKFWGIGVLVALTIVALEEFRKSIYRNHQ